MFGGWGKEEIEAANSPLLIRRALVGIIDSLVYKSGVVNSTGSEAGAGARNRAEFSPSQRLLSTSGGCVGADRPWNRVEGTSIKIGCGMCLAWPREQTWPAERAYRRNRSGMLKGWLQEHRVTLLVVASCEYALHEQQVHCSTVTTIGYGRVTVGRHHTKVMVSTQV
jgi:hypothetical protein